MNEGIQIQQISKTFSQKSVLKKLSIQINKGEIFGLLGPSGAGKTTLIKILTGQIKADEGQAFILGQHCTHLREAQYRQIGMVLDTSGVYQRLSCYDNLKIFATLYNIPAKTIEETLQRVGLLEDAKKEVSKLSKGMKQRLVLARAILHKPSILFLDEPTSGLDPTTTKQIHQLLLDMQKEGVTIFLTTHNMEEATKLCNHVALLHEGEIIEYGMPEEICQRHNTENEIHIVCKNKKVVTFLNVPENAPILASYFERNDVVSIRSSEPSLETVFIRLTGRGLAS
jgi:ABC-2 type transport system ATP-binding protein